MGKSERCLKFAEDHRDEFVYSGIFSNLPLTSQVLGCFLDATSLATADQGYANIGRRCGVADTSVESVKSWLALNNKRWLLIIDNADNPVIDYSQYIPFNKSGDILFTTRNHECELYNTVGSERLEHLEHEYAQQLLLRVAYPNESQRKEKEQAALSVVKMLVSHTLAIIQAGAFIKQKFCRLEEYPAFFREKKGDILKFHSKQHESEYGNVYATFEVSSRYLQDSNNQENLDALSLLHTLAFMHSMTYRRQYSRGLLSMHLS